VRRFFAWWVKPVVPDEWIAQYPLYWLVVVLALAGLIALLVVPHV
jgi:hypothetical protein